MAFGLRNVADTGRALREMVRVCRPDGQVAVLEFSMPTRQPLRALDNWYFRNVLPRIGRVFARSADQAYDYLPSSVGEFPSGAALAEMLSAAGLERVEFKLLTFGVATLYVGRKPAETARSTRANSPTAVAAESREGIANVAH